MAATNMSALSGGSSLLALALVAALPSVVLMIPKPKPPTRDWTTPISTMLSLVPTSPPLSSLPHCARRLLMAPLAPFPCPKLTLPCQCVWSGTPRDSATPTVPVLAITLFIPRRMLPWSSGARRRGTSPIDNPAWVLGSNFYRISITSILIPCYPVATPIAFITSITPPPMSAHCPVLRTTAHQEKGPSACFFAIQVWLF
jgi:hypothetical protein